MKMIEFLFSFQGRIGRAHFWLIQLLELAVVLVGASAFGPDAEGAVLAALLVCAAMFLSSGVRRWHDLGRTGWWQLFVLVPFIGVVLILWICGVTRGQDGANQYGPKPRILWR